MDERSGEENLLDLPESHLRRITATLRVVDERLDEIERWVSGPHPSGPLYRWRQDLGEENIEEVRAGLAEVRSELEEVNRTLGLVPHEKTASSSVMVAALFSVIDLEDIEPKRMKGCGALPEEKSMILAELWPRLSRPLEQIRRACHAGARKPSRLEHENDP